MAVHKVEDDVVWRLVKNLDVIRRKVLRRLDDEAPDEARAPSGRTSNPTRRSRISSCR